ncbi:protein FAF-like, chloroplastic [Impatiens glandulifera]|uniref:protein FAF-like, chloroplastic n=1 Tax=Impatiens glandulifera TaxID=253017 RepID=UPI001FB0B43B|nr:protein FAF-like, chloroplastic [Impatiens glandulifera]
MGQNNNECAISDLWSSIFCNKKTNLPPYIHPLSNKSSSALSNKSLDICTESLCSETGFDSFSSSYLSSGQEDLEYNHHTKNKSKPQVMNIITSPSRSIPPPLPSLVGGGNGSSLVMQSRRLDGRLILEAVSLPSSKSCFQTQRLDGRLLLKLEKSLSVDDKEEIKEGEGCHLS